MYIHIYGTGAISRRGARVCSAGGKAVSNPVPSIFSGFPVVLRAVSNGLFFLAVTRNGCSLEEADVSCSSRCSWSKQEHASSHPNPLANSWLIALGGLRGLRRAKEVENRKGGRPEKGKQTNLGGMGRIALTKEWFSRSITVFGLLTNLLFSLSLSRSFTHYLDC